MAGAYEAGFAEGLKLASAGRLPEAAEVFERLTESEPSRHEGFMQLGLIADWNGELQASVAHFRRAVSLQPNDVEALFNLGVLLGKTQELAAAAETFEALLKLDSDHRDAREKLAWLYSQSGRTDEVLQQLRRARELAEGDADALRNVGTTYAKLDQLAAAVECYQAALVLAPGRTDLRELLGMALCDVNRPDAALRHLEFVAKHVPTDAVARRRLASTYLQTGQCIEAAEAFRAAYQLEPSDESALGLATALFLQGRHAEARACLPRMQGEGTQVLLHHGPASEWAMRGQAEYREKLSSAVAPDGRLFQPFLMHVKKASVISGEWPLIQGNELLFDLLVHNPPKYPGRSAFFQLSSPDHALLRLPSKRMSVDRPAILVGSTGNYYHWLMDHAARLMLVEDEPACADLPVLVGAGLASYEADTLERLGIGPERRIAVEPETVCECAELWIPSLVTQRTVPHPDAVRWLRDRLAKLSDSPSRRLFVSRSDAAWRRMLNEEEVFQVLARHGFEKVSPVAMSLDEQIATFGQAEVIVGAHGAGLANVLFAPPRARLLELSSFSYPAEFFTVLAASIGQRSARVAGHVAGTQTSLPHKSDFTIDTRELEQSLKKLLAEA